jgi:hypothetical protein
MLITGSGDSFVDCYLPYFRHGLINCPLLAFLPFNLCSLKVHMEISSLLLPISTVLSEHHSPSAVCPFQFLVYYSVFFFKLGRGQSAEGAMLIYPRVAMGISHATYLLTCCSASPKQVQIQHLAPQEPSCFLSVKWSGEALYRLGVQDVGVLLLLGGFFLPIVAPASQ